MGRIVSEKPFVEEENLVSRSKIKLVDLFAGIGGFHYGVAAAAAKINKGVKPLLVSEIETSCQETYRLNHKCEVQGDINKISLRGVNGSVFEGDEAYIRFSVSKGESILKRLSDLPNRLGEICQVKAGVVANPDKFKKSHRDKFSKVTAKDGEGIFVLNSSETRKLENSPHLKPFYKNSDVFKFGSSSATDLSIIYLNRELKPTKEEKLHLEKFRDILERRREVVNQLIPWYSLHWPREQNMFEGPKIVCPQRSNLNTFGYNELSWYASADVYFIAESNTQFPLKAVLGLLNSKLYYYWLYNRGKRKGEMLELYQVPLSEIPLPNLSAPEAKNLTFLVDDCIKLASEDKSVVQAEGLLNKFINEMFELTIDEIGIIDSAYELAQSRRSVKIEDEESVD